MLRVPAGLFRQRFVALLGQQRDLNAAALASRATT